MKAAKANAFAWYAFYCYALISIALFIRATSAGLYEGGDTVLHYLIVKGVPHTPQLLFDHWGKPLFTLLSLPFSYFGFFGIALFNGLCAWFTCLAAWHLLPTSRAYLWLFPILLLCSAEYFVTLVSGSTETLFGMLFIAVLALEQQQRSRWAAVIAGATVLARPEAIGLLPIYVLFLVWQKKWKTILFVSLVPVVYSVVGGLVQGDFLWILNKDPYGDSSAIYGSGDALHYLRNSSRILGAVVKWCSLFTIPALLYWLLKKQGSNQRTVQILLVGVCAVGLMWAVHSYIWSNGMKGSLGLLRVLSSSVPVLAAVLVFVAARVFKGARRPSRKGMVAIVVLAAIGCYQLPKEVQIPAERSPKELLADKAVDWLNAQDLRYRRVVALDPLLPLGLELDAFNTDEYYSLFGFKQKAPALSMQHGDLLVWDAHYCPNEGKLPLAYFDNRADFRKLTRIAPNIDFSVLNNERMFYEVFEYRGTPLVDHGQLVSLSTGQATGTFYFHGLQQVANDSLFFEKTEYVFGTDGLDWNSDWPSQIGLEFSGEYTPTIYTPLHFVVEHLEGDSVVSYQPQYLPPGRFHIYTVLEKPNENKHFKVYFWNPKQVNLALVDLRVTAYSR